MEIDPGLKQEPPGSDHSEHSTVPSPTFAINPGAASLIPLEGDDSLTLLPEVQATGRPAGSRRPFQRRRRSRACDACRARKTKCDTPDHGPCSACVSASLVCKFSGGEDRRRAGPARRVRALESTVQELTRKLAETENKLQHMALSCSETGSTEKAPHSPINSEFSIASPRFRGSSSNHECKQSCSSPKDDSYGEPGGYGGESKDQRRHELYQKDGTSWDHHIFGPSSCPSFLHSYNDYLSRLGYRPPPAPNPTMNTGGPPSPSPNTRIPNPSVPNKYLPFDLRALLPPLKLAKQMFEVFRTTVQNYTPIFYWPSLELKIERAWKHPIWDGDNEAVRSVFCVIMMLLAVANQLIEPGELDGPEGGDWAHVQERNGWMFFEFGRKYSNLNNPDYTIDDAIYLLLMAFYLDKAFLPSPCWMITGAMARVCQDIGIYRHTPSGLYDDITVECRTRLFWAAYIQDRKISMKLGRPIIFLDQHIDVGLPGLPGTNKGREDNQENDNQETPTRQDDQGSPGSPGVANMIDHQDDFNDQETETSLQVFKATIYIAKASENLLNIELKQNGGEEDVKHLQNIDEMLKKAWEVFPSEMTDLRRSDVLDLPAVRPLFHLQHSRIILYRYFTDFTGTPSLLREFRTFCLAQSIQVAKITAHILSRVIKNPGFDRIFGLRTDELVLIHTFRAATVLLLGHYCNDRSLLDVTTDEVGVCARALKSAARSHSLGQKLLELFQNFAKMFGYQTGVTGELSHPIPEASDTIDEKLEEIHGVSTPKGPWDNVESSSAVATPQYNNAVYGGYHTLQGNTPRWIPTTNISLVPTYQQLLHTSQPVTQPPPLPHPLPLPHTLPHPQSQSQEHHQTHSGLIFVDPGIGGAGLPTSVEENPQGSLPDQQSPMPHQINWDVYQQVLTFDPNFEVYMGGPSHRRFLYDRGE